MEPKYDHSQVEGKIYQMWEEGGYFKPEINPSGLPYSIILPPPNANADLHLGHALFTVEDILIRYHRMKGEAALWLPGLDHAGIETQFVFEKKLKKEGKSRFDFDRETLYKMIWDFVEENKSLVRGQLAKLGFSLDWSREKFTLDPDITKIVYQTFEKLKADGLVYRGERIVNYCPHCGTAYSDLEVNYIEKEDKLYFLDYGTVTIATTRPETIFADIAVAVNPKDKRYKKLVGKTAIIPLLNQMIPIIADEKVEIKFGTGALKVTPAHDPLDFDIGERHNLEKLTVINRSGRLENVPEKYLGLKVMPAREAVLIDLKESGKLIREEVLIHNVGTCYKCGNTIEPMIAEQWFIKIKPLAEPAIEAVKNGKIKIVPKSFEKTFFQWMNSIRDWNISRQIVWGIKIPGEGERETFDTWFSSGQWPFATLMASPFTDDYKKFYPTTVMETGYDILFFWVARMIMLGIYTTGKVPFETIYLHGLVRDKEGQKMSKSKGNVINPIEMADKYGADSLRMALIINVGPGQDQKMYEEKIISQRNFSNKIWNIGRFILTAENKEDLEKESEKDKELKTLMKKTTKAVTSDLEKFKLGTAAEKIYQAMWHELADKYLEDYKKGLVSYSVLLDAYTTLLKLLHPFMPFITEEIWSRLPHQEKTPLIISSWPK